MASEASALRRMSATRPKSSPMPCFACARSVLWLGKHRMKVGRGNLHEGKRRLKAAMLMTRPKSVPLMRLRQVFPAAKLVRPASQSVSLGRRLLDMQVRRA